MVPRGARHGHRAGRRAAHLAVVDELLAGGGELTWQAGPLAANAGLCHGTAGNGYAFLRLFERTGDERWLERAQAFAMHAAAQAAEGRRALRTRPPHALHGRRGRRGLPGRLPHGRRALPGARRLRGWNGEHVFAYHGAMTAQGNPRTTYQRALRAGDPMLVLSALRDVASPTLGETLMACLVLARARRLAGAAGAGPLARAVGRRPRRALRPLARAPGRAGRVPESTEALRRVLDAAGDLDTVATLDRLAWPSRR